MIWYMYVLRLLPNPSRRSLVFAVTSLDRNWNTTTARMTNSVRL